MNLIVCLDDRNGMAFHGRRQSRDRYLTADVLTVVREKRLWMAPETAELFEELTESILVDADFPDMASSEDYCFCEDDRWLSCRSPVGSIIVYRWNRVYPADLRFPEEELLKRFCSVEKEFAGFSHPRITRERYTL